MTARKKTHAGFRKETWLLVVGILAAWCPAARSQEPTALEAALTMEKVLVDAIARAEKSVVAIARVRNRDEPRPLAVDPFDQQPPKPDPTDPRFVPNEYASGVVIDRAGFILTTYHSLGDPKENTYYVWVNRRPFKVDRIEAPAQIIAGDPWTDLAILKIDADDLEPITFGDTANLRKGQIVIGLGNPYAIARDGQASASWGIISNLSRRATNYPTSVDHTERDKTLHHHGTLIQTDVKLNLGTSGGALLNLKGEMIGLTTSLAAMQRYEKAAGFAIPIDEAVKETIETLKAGDKPAFGFLGVRPEDLSAELRRRGQQGVRIAYVAASTPADVAGMLTGDIVTHINGEPIYDSSDLMRDLGKWPAGRQVSLTVRRGAGLTRLNVKLSKKYVELASAGYSQSDDHAWRGMRVDYATAVPFSVLERSHQIDPRGCVAIVDVETDSPAWRADMRPWTFVSHVDNRRVTTPKEFYQAVAGKTGDVKLELTAPQGGTTRVRTVSP